MCNFAVTLIALAWATPNEGLHLRVVDEAGKPAPSARVRVLDVEDVGADELRAHGIWKLVARRGELVELDADGTADIDVPEVEAFITADTATLSGCALVTGGAPRDVVVKLPGDALDVRVLDAAGRPAVLVDVVLRASLGEAMAEAGAELDFPDALAMVRWSERTGNDGRVVLNHPEERFMRGAPMKHEITVGLPLGKAPSVTLTPERRGLIELRLPETGSVVVKMEQAPSSWVRMRRLPPSLAGPLARGERTFWRNNEAPRASFLNGEARFPYVGVGLTLQLEAHWEGMVAPASLVGPGPRAPGEEVVFRFEGRDAPGGIAVDPGRVTLFEGRTEVPVRAVYLCAKDLENESFWLCVVPAVPDVSNRHFELFVGGERYRLNGWHASAQDACGHTLLQLDDLEAVERLARQLSIPIARRLERPYTLKAELSTERDAYAPGDEVRVRIEVTNVGGVPVTRQDGRFRFDVHCDDLWLPDRAKRHRFGGSSHGERIPPGGSFEDRALLNRSADLSRPGHYHVDAVYVMQLSETPLPFDQPLYCDWLLENFEDELTGTFEFDMR